MVKFIQILQYTDLFQSLSYKEIEDLFTKNSYTIRNYKKNTVIHFQNEQCTTLDLILKGTLSIQGIDSMGNYITISDFTDSDTIGGNLIFANRNFYPMTILSKTDASILHLKKELIIKICQHNSLFLTNFLQAISDKTLILTDKIKTLSFKSIRQCLVEFLIYESHLQKNNVIILGMTKKELAEKFGVQRTSLSRELSKLKAKGLVEYDAKSITILNMEALTNLDK